MRSKLIGRIAPAGLALAIAPIAAALEPGPPQFFGPTPYLCSSDSPFDLSGVPFTFALEDFEDGVLDTPGVMADVGAVTGPGGITDSVDCDDGLIDMSGQLGLSYFSVPGSAGILFTFDAGAIGGLPTSAGIVWTDGATFNEVIFEAFDAASQSLGQIVESGVGDGNFNNGTDEDRFFGVTDPGGISAIRIISNPQGPGSGIEVDHLQYGPISICVGDVDGDMNVSVTDLLQLLAEWGICPGCASDLNEDGVVDVVDLLAMLAGWGSCV